MMLSKMIHSILNILAEKHFNSVATQSVIMPSAIMLSVVILIVVAPDT